MAYTTLQKEFWSDDYVLNLNKDQKLVYLYIISNEKTTQCGIYEIPLLKATTELAMIAEEFLIHLKKFTDDKKIQYSLETQEICVINWIKHNENTSWKTMERVKKELARIKNPNLVVLLYDPRKPLFDGIKKKKVGDKQYVEEPFVIENPWKGLFKELTDDMLIEIRRPFTKQAPLMPLLSPFDAPCKGYLPKTNTLHNITNTEHIHKQSNNIVKPEKEKTPKKESSLHMSIKETFLSKNDNQFTDYGKEGKAINALIKKAETRFPEDPTEFIKQVIETFYNLLNGNDKFWTKHPFIPSRLNSSGVWDSVLVEMKEEEFIPTEPDYENMDTGEIIF